MPGAEPPGLAPGASAPLGAIPCREGVNFSGYSRHATGVALLLFDQVDDTKAVRVIPIDPTANRTYHYWHVFPPGLTAGQLYGYRVEGPSDPANGMRSDPTKVLLDPYGGRWWFPRGTAATPPPGPATNTATAMKSVGVDPVAYDWEGDAPLRRPSAASGAPFFRASPPRGAVAPPAMS
jgi:glycogen operon protein